MGKAHAPQATGPAAKRRTYSQPSGLQAGQSSTDIGACGALCTRPVVKGQQSARRAPRCQVSLSTLRRSALAMASITSA